MTSTQSKIYRFANAIAVAEGWFAPGENSEYPSGTLSWRNHNPGNLTSSPFQVGAVEGKSVFANDQEGIAAIVWQLWEYINGSNEHITPETTISGTILIYTGLEESSENFTNYLATVTTGTGVAATDTIGSLLTQ